MSLPGGRMGAQGTSAASRRSSPSAVVCRPIYSAILLMRAVALTERADGVANPGSLASSGSPEARQNPCHSESEMVPAVVYTAAAFGTRIGRRFGPAVVVCSRLHHASHMHRRV